MLVTSLSSGRYMSMLLVTSMAYLGIERRVFGKVRTLIYEVLFLFLNRLVLFESPTIVYELLEPSVIGVLRFITVLLVFCWRMVDSVSSVVFATVTFICYGVASSVTS